MSVDDLRERLAAIMNDPSQMEGIQRISSGSKQRAYLSMSGEVMYKLNMQQEVGMGGRSAMSKESVPLGGFAWIDGSPPSASGPSAVKA